MNKEFLKIATENQNLLRKVCNTFCNDEDDRKDLLQDILIQLWKSYPTFRQESKVTTWMYRVALNTAITRYRKVKSKPESRSISDSEIEIITRDRSFEQKEQIDNLYKAINKLSDVEKSIILLYLEDYNSDEIAEIVGISSNYVRVKVNRIKSKLKEYLEKIYE